MAELEIKYPDGLTGFRELNPDKPLTIGSDETCGLQLKSRRLQPVHAMVRCQQGRFQIESSGDAPIQVNGEPVESAILKAGDRIVIGKFRLTFRDKANEYAYDSLDIDVGLEMLSDSQSAMAVPRDELMSGTVRGRAGTPGGPSPVSPLLAARYIVPWWRSPLILGIAGSLVMLGLLGLLFLQLYRSNDASQQYDEALKDLEQGSFAQSVKRFDKFLADYPADERAQEAEVWRGVARVRQFTEGTAPTWRAAYDELEKFLDEHGQKKPFRDHAADIAPLVLKVAYGLATTARDNKDAQVLQLAKTTLDWSTRRLPREQIGDDQLDQTRAVIAEAERGVNEAAALATSLSAMDAALTNSQPLRVTAIHRDLYRTYAGFRSHPEITIRLEKAKQLERTLVRFEGWSGKSETTAATEPLAAGTGFVRRKNAPDAMPSDRAMTVVVADMLFGLDPATGSVRWRQPIGLSPAFHPISPATDPKSILVHRPTDNSVALLEGATGKERWRQPLGDVSVRWPTKPLIHQDVIYLVTEPLLPGNKPTPDAPVSGGPASGGKQELESGRLDLLRLSSGERLGYFQFPQPLSASPVADPDRGNILVCGREASLYSLLPRERRCEDVVLLDHEPNSVHAPPVFAGRFLFIAESLGPRQSRLRCLVASSTRATVVPRQTIDLDGWVVRVPASVGGRLFVVTDRDQFLVVDLGSEADQQPLAVAARSPKTLEEKTSPPFIVAISERDFWTIGNELRHYELTPAKTTPDPSLRLPLPGAPVQPPILDGDHLVVVSRPNGRPTVIVTAINRRSGQETWVTELGLAPDAVFRNDGPESGLVAVIDGTALAVPSVSGQLTESVVGDSRTSPTSPLRAIGSQVEIRAVQTSADGLLAYIRQPPGPLIHYSGIGAGRVIAPTVTVALAPVPHDGGILVASQEGVLYWIDVESGREKADPYVFPYMNGRTAAPRGMAPIDARTVALAAGPWLIRLQREEMPFPHFREAARIVIGKVDDKGEPVEDGNQSLVPIVALNGQLLVAIGDELRVFESQNLDLVGSHDLGATSRQLLVSTTASHAVLLTSVGDLIGVPGDGDMVKYRRRLSSIPIGWVADGDAFWTADPAGILTRRRFDTGESIDEISLGHLLRRGPWLAGEQLAVVDLAGAIWTVDRRDAKAGKP